MHNISKESYVSKIAKAAYVNEFKRIYGQNIFSDANKTSIKHIKLTNEEEDALVAFLMTLTDGYTHYVK
jgi:hypothetical protein